jgi:peptidoglycan L-alanyl-D-glutamate endopeptidase CwlK
MRNYHYSNSSKKRLATCYIDLQLCCYELLKYFDHSVIFGYRNEEEQNKIFEAGNSKLKFPNSKHNLIPAMAVDIAPYPREPERTQAEYDKFSYMAGMFMLISEQLFEYSVNKNSLITTTLN